MVIPVSTFVFPTAEKFLDEARYAILFFFLNSFHPPSAQYVVFFSYDGDFGSA